MVFAVRDGQEKSTVKTRTLKTEGCGTPKLLTALRVLHPA